MKNTPKAASKHGAQRLDRFTVRLILGTRRASQRICSLSGYSKGYVSDIIRGRRRPTQRFLDAMVEAIGADSEERQRAAIRSRYAVQLGEEKRA